MRLLIDLAINTGRKRKSSQTGYLHHCYHVIEQEPHLPIPLIENFLFVLALLKSRTVENIQEAKGLLDGLLHFQNRNGNFPVYLHDFPVCKDHFTGIHAACAIYWILKQFHQVLGYELKKRLEEALGLVAKHALMVHVEINAPYPIKMKIAALSLAAGRFLADDQLSDQGAQSLATLSENFEKTCLFCPASLGSIAASLMMVYPRLSDSPWKFLWDHLESTWHRKTASYAGPSLKEWQQEGEPHVTLYDFICGHFSDGFSERAQKESIVHLESVLIPASNERFQPLNYPLEIQGNIHGTRWFLYHGEQFAYSTFEKKAAVVHQSIEKGFSPFRLLWGDVHRVHTFACQGGNAKTVAFDGTDLLFHLEGSPEVEDKEKSREILFFVDTHEGVEFLVSGQKASTFLLGEEVGIKDKQMRITLSFHLEDGGGRFLGHRMLGNRLAQLAIKGAARFNAYDWQLFLRTISRSETCRIRVKLKINPTG